MKKKRTFQTVRVQQVQLAKLLPVLAAGCIVALDIAKQKFAVALMTLTGELAELFRFDHPTETRDFLRLVEGLRAGVAKVTAAMEPTGTYGDAIRYQLAQLGVPVRMVSPKRTHDSREVFDGTRTLHDPKSAMIVGKLCSLDLASEPWKPPSELRARLRALVDLRHHQLRVEELGFSRLEALLARHWPEFGRWMDPREQVSALHLLRAFPSPSRVSEKPADVKALLKDASRSRLSPEALEGVIETATATMGVPMVAEEEALVRELSDQLLTAYAAKKQIAQSIQEVGKDDSQFVRLARWMGAYTAAVIITHVDPLQYTTARQLLKACGLNLCEKSSGQVDGRLHISKRGPGLVRQVVYLFALRMIQESPPVRAWYMKRDSYTAQSKQRALTAVMRKLVGALHHVARGAAFDANKLFDMRRLELDSNGNTTAVSLEQATTSEPVVPSPEQVAAAPKKKAISPRTEPRPIARRRNGARERMAASA